MYGPSLIGFEADLTIDAIRSCNLEELLGRSVVGRHVNYTRIGEKLWTCGDCTYQGGQRSPQAAARDGVEFELWPAGKLYDPHNKRSATRPVFIYA